MTNDENKRGWLEANRIDHSRLHDYEYSLTQRVFLVLQHSAVPLDRAEIMRVLNVGELGLDHALRRLKKSACVTPAPGMFGFYVIVPGAKMPEDTRGKNLNSFGNRGSRA